METMSQPVAFIVGRMNPPTPGHIDLIYELVKFAESIGARPYVFVTLSSNVAKMTVKQAKTPIHGLRKTNPKPSDPLFPYVKHPSYQNPLSPEVKLTLIKTMLLNKYGFDPAVLEAVANDMIQISGMCNGIYKALGCVHKLQPNPEQIYFVMGAETDPVEREQRERFCLNKSDGTTTVQTSDGSLVNCHFVQRTDDGSLLALDPAKNSKSSLSGSKIRLLAVNNEYSELNDIYRTYLTEPEVLTLVEEIKKGVNLASVAAPVASETAQMASETAPVASETVQMASVAAPVPDDNPRPSKRLRTARGGTRKAVSTSKAVSTRKAVSTSKAVTKRKAKGKKQNHKRKITRKNKKV
jgi:hypothetical protein